MGGQLKVELRDELRELVERYDEYLAQFPFPQEQERWKDLVLCLFSQCVENNEEKVVKAVDLLDELNLLTCDQLGSIDLQGSEGERLASLILARLGYSQDEASRVKRVLAHAAKTIQRDHGGKVQRFLRNHGLAAREELANKLFTDDITDARIKFAVTQWLQDSAGFPISLEHRSITDFCNARGITVQDLLLAADDIDLNVSLLDDLMAIASHDGSDSPDVAPRTGTPTAVGSPVPSPQASDSPAVGLAPATAPPETGSIMITDDLLQSIPASNIPGGIVSRFLETNWGTTGRKWLFQVQRWDKSGAPLAPTSVEMRGISIRGGYVRDGDLVELREGKWVKNVFRANEVLNRSTNELIRTHSWH